MQSLARPQRFQFLGNPRLLPALAIAALLLSGVALPLRAADASSEADERGAARVAVDLVPCGGLESVPADASIRAVGWIGQSGDGGGEVAEGVLELEPAAAEAGGRFVFALDPDRRWHSVANEPDLWVPARRLDGRGGEVRVPAWRSGLLAGSVTMPRGETPPDHLRVRLRPPGWDGPGRRRGEGPCDGEVVTAPCPVGEEGEFLCPVPAGRWSVALDAEGWAPAYLGRMELMAGEPRSAEPIRLRRGAHLLGRLTTVDGPADPETAHVWALRADQAEGALRALESVGADAPPSEGIDERGYFLFEHLPPGQYFVVARQPGFARTAPRSVTLEDAEEHVLDPPLVLAPPSRLEVRVTPPTDLHGEPWRVELFRDPLIGHLTSKIDEGSTEGGIWVADAVDGGFYSVYVRDSAGQRWFDRHGLELVRGEDRFVDVDLDLVPVEGTATLADESLRGARVWFGGRSGATSIEVETDEEGAFQLVLPRDGEWKFDLSSDDPSVRHGGEVEVPEDGGRVEIELPDTRVAGEVVLEDGSAPTRPTTVGLLRIDGPGGQQAVRSERDGTFEVLGLAPGSYELGARAGDLTAVPAVVDVLEDVDPPRVRLVLRDLVPITGTLVSSHGPVAGAELVVFPLDSAGNRIAGSFSPQTTDASGRFTDRVPAQTGQLLIFAQPLGHGYTAVRTRDLEPTIVVARPEATLRLEVPEEAGFSQAGELTVLLHDGDWIPYHDLLPWALKHGEELGGEELRVPAMPAGEYLYCRMTFAEHAAVLAGRALPVGCSSGSVSPGGALALSLP